MILPLGPFTGLDLRPGSADVKGALVEALNVIVNTNGALVRRRGLNFRVRLPATTAGLYAVGNQLRTLAFHATSDTGMAPTVYLDYCSSDVTGADVLGTLVDSAGATMAMVSLSTGVVEIHHCGEVGVDGSATTLVSVEGSPGFFLMGMESRAWALSADLSSLNFSSLDNKTPAKLDIWTNPSGDDVSAGGYISVGQYASGAGRPVGLANFGGRMAIFYEGATQVWRLDTDNSRFFKEAVLPTVGTKAAKSAASVVSDILLLTNAGVRSLTTVSQTLNPAEDPVGGRVDVLVNELGNRTGARPVAIYSRSLGCYLLAFGVDVLCLSLTPGQGIHGWSRWVLPVEVDHWTEANGTVWIRSGRNVFSMDAVDADDTNESGGSQPVPVRWETGSRRYVTGFDVVGITTVATESHRVQVVVDSRPAVAVPSGDLLGSPVTMPGRAPASAFASQSKRGYVVAVRGQDDATAATWRLDGMTLQLNQQRNT